MARLNDLDLGDGPDASLALPSRGSGEKRLGGPTPTGVVDLFAASAPDPDPVPVPVAAPDLLTQADALLESLPTYQVTADGPALPHLHDGVVEEVHTPIVYDDRVSGTLADLVADKRDQIQEALPGVAEWGYQDAGPAPATTLEPMAVTVDDVLKTLDPFAYISGRAGTGKTTLARQLLEARDDCVLCATTGIAAVNLGNATTLNSLLLYFDTASLQQSAQSGFLKVRLQKLRMSGINIILVDEVSMLPAEQLTCIVEAMAELNAGIGYDKALADALDDDRDWRMKLLLVGDFGQLPPVEAPYAFESPVWGDFEHATLKLEKVWRQDNQQFAAALQQVRLGRAAEALPTLRPCFTSAMDINFDGTTIVSKNAQVDMINERRHAALPGSPLVWKAIRSGEQQKDWITKIPEAVAVKPGALVMCLMNRPVPSMGDISREYFYVNGDLGYVVEYDLPPKTEIEGGREDPKPFGIKVRLQRTGEIVTVVPHTKEWKDPHEKPREVGEDYKAQPGEVVSRVRGDDGVVRRMVSSRVKGTVTYMPLRLAYATTVHKSQGLSLDKVQVGIADWMFTKPGMMYVALSRCRTLEGLRIVGTEKMFLARCAVDPKVARFL